MNDIIRPLAHNLGFDAYGQLNVRWEEDNSTHSIIIPDLREYKCAICGRKWEVEAKSFKDHHYVRLIEEFAHMSCYLGHLNLVEAQLWCDALCEVRDKQEPKIGWGWKKIPNEYRGAWDTHWYRIHFKGYMPWMKVGTRKRVWHLGLHDLRPEQITKFEELFKDDTSTKGVERPNVYMHAWDKQEIRRHLERYFQIIAMDEPFEEKKAESKFKAAIAA
jgi:hypothetical protein